MRAATATAGTASLIGLGAHRKGHSADSGKLAGLTPSNGSYDVAAADAGWAARFPETHRAARRAKAARAVNRSGWSSVTVRSTAGAEPVIGASQADFVLVEPARAAPARP